MLLDFSIKKDWIFVSIKAAKNVCEGKELTIKTRNYF
jgi:hypothetical protein